jgi:acetate---CoA ligase (ADP-forming) subunit alpha
LLNDLPQTSSSNASDLSAFFEPKSIAVVGASNTEGRIGFEVIRNLKDQGFLGIIIPVNPSIEEVLGLKCRSSLASIGEPVELCVIVVRATEVSKIIREGVSIGTRHYIVQSAGFKEIGREGELLEDELAQLVKKERIRVVGPNCLGVFDNTSRVDTFFIPRRLVQRPRSGVVSLASQSGSFVGHFLDLAASENLGVARAVTYGNRVDVDESDTLNYFREDDKTDIVCLYIEGVKDGSQFVNAARLCSQRKTIIALKTGKYEQTSIAIASHTGALAGSYESYRAAFKKADIVEVNSLDEFVDTCNVLSKLPRARGNRVLILGHAGGLGLTVADHCIRAGLVVPTIPAETQDLLRQNTVPYASLANPIDLTASGTDGHAKSVLEVGFVERNIADIAIYLALWGLPQSSDRIGQIISEAVSKSGKPIVVASIAGRVCREKRHVFEDLGIPVFESLERASVAASHLVKTS